MPQFSFLSPILPSSLGSQTCSCSHLPSVFKGVDIVSSASLGMGITGVQEIFSRVVGPILLRLLLLFDQALFLMCAAEGSQELIIVDEKEFFFPLGFISWSKSKLT